MTSDEIAERTRRAQAAAVSSARALGLEVGDPVILHDVFSLVVHLAPLPLVARVPLVLPPGLRGTRQLERMQRELDVVDWLAQRGFPVVPPSSLVPLAPVQHGGFQITFWELADVADDHVAYGASDMALTARLNTELRGYAGILPFLSPIAHTVPQCIEALGASPELIGSDDLDRLRREWEVLGKLFASEESFLTRFPGANIQVIHGDAPSHNVIRTKSGIRMADFEDVTRGPIEFDLALMPEEEVAKYDEEAVRLGMPPADPRIIGVMNSARMLQIVASLALVPQLPILEEGLKSSVEAWRQMPFAARLASA